MIRSLFAGVSGMENHQTAMDVIGNNIANVDTVGFKEGRVTFADQVSQLVQGATAPGGASVGLGGVNPQQVGLGMLSHSIDTIMTQGSLQTTGNVTDLAIQGNGFFTVADGPAQMYTRAGNFTFDSTGSLVDAHGNKVQGWPATQSVDSLGQTIYAVNNSTPIGNIQIPAGAVIPPQQTTEIDLAGNLQQSTPTTPPTPPATTPANYFDTSENVFDSLGNEHFITVRFTHQTASSGGSNDVWTWNVIDPTATVNSTAAAGTTGPGGAPQNPGGISTAQALNFSASNGLLAVTTGVGGQYVGGSVNLSWTLPDKTVTSTTITPNFGNQGQASGMTQFGTASTAVISNQNGYTRGELTGIAIDQSGTINGVFSNGRQQLLGQVAIATFSNPGGLMKQGDNDYIKTPNSGDAVIRQPGEAEAGTITSGALEQSNVDLADQFSQMIVIQRGFEANSKVITTSDQLLQTLMNLKQ